jgi:long-chain fatty acid transport protein
MSISRSGLHRWGINTAVLTLLAIAGQAHGGAFEVLQQSPRASGQADAFIAQADDPSAIWYNPAGLTQLTGTHFLVAGYIVLPSYRFDGPTSDASMRQPSFLPQIYAESDFGLERFRFGLGVNNVFGIHEDWGSDTPFATVFTKGHLYVINIQPTIAYQLTDSLSVGVGLNVYFGSLSLNRKQLLGPPPTPEGSFYYHGDGWAVGASPALMWKINEQNSVGVYYHSPFRMDIDGPAQVTANGIPPIGPTHSKLPIQLPQSVGLGYALWPTRSWKMEVDGTWSDWSTLQQIQFQSSNPAFNNQAIPAKWHDTWAVRLGTQYELTKNWTIRGGFSYGTNAVPESTFGPIVPDSNYYLFSVGAGYKTGSWTFEAAYLFIYREPRHISNSFYSPAVNGTWSTNLQGILLGVQYDL